MRVVMKGGNPDVLPLKPGQGLVKLPRLAVEGPRVKRLSPAKLELSKAVDPSRPNVLDMSSSVITLKLETKGRGGEDPLAVGQFGLLGGLPVGTRVIMDVLVKKDDGAYSEMVRIDEDRNMHPVPVIKHPEGRQFIRRMNVFAEDRGSSHTSVEENSIMLLSFGRTGIVAVTVFTVKSQSGLFYFMAQGTWSVQAYAENVKGREGLTRKVVCPALIDSIPRWVQLNERASRYYLENPQLRLPPVAQYEKAKLPLLGLKDKEVYVTVSSFRRGLYGGILANGEGVRIYEGEILSSARAPQLPKFASVGEVVRANAIVPIPPGEGTNFKWDALRVFRDQFYGDSGL